MPITVMIVSRTMSGRSRDDRRRAPETLSCATPTCLRFHPMTSERKGNDENRLRARPARPAVLDVAVRKPEAQIGVLPTKVRKSPCELPQAGYTQRDTSFRCPRNQTAFKPLILGA